MKREIKFRAWDESFGIMVYDIDPDHYEVYFNGNQLTCRPIDGNGDPFTLPLLQFTGLRDENGKEIYEGDIITSRLYPFQDGYTHDVYFKDGDFRLRWTMFRLSEMFEHTHTDIEVIGNIYENPELLKA